MGTVKVSNIEKLNIKTYSKIANEYTPLIHKTTALFYELGDNLFDLEISKINQKSNILEIGSGRGYLTDKILRNNPDSIITDISMNMLTKIRSDRFVKKICCSVFSLPFLNNQFQFVLSSLASSFLIDEALKEIYRVLVKNGFFIFSYPSKITFNKIRTNENLNAFIDINGNKLMAYSFLYDEEQLNNIAQRNGFNIIEYKTISKKIADNKYDIPILQFVKIRKY